MKESISQDNSNGDTRAGIDPYRNETVSMPPPDKKSPGSKKGWLAIIGALAIILGKLKFLLVFLKLGKFMSTGISMLITIYFYSLAFGWKYGAGFVALIFVHEMGHYLAAHRLALDVSAPIFIPFIGAFIAMKDQPPNAVIEAKVGLGGPLLGSLAALLCLLYGIYYDEQLAIALAYSGFLINLFNLIPISPLDGGRIVAAISPKLWLVGIPVLVVTAYYYFNPLILMLLILGAYQAYQQWKSSDPSFYNTPGPTRITFSVWYFGLLLGLGMGMTYIHNVYPIG